MHSVYHFDVGHSDVDKRLFALMYRKLGKFDLGPSQHHIRLSEDLVYEAKCGMPIHLRRGNVDVSCRQVCPMVQSHGLYVSAYHNHGLLSLHVNGTTAGTVHPE
jgi:hypothetical protein